MIVENQFMNDFDIQVTEFLTTTEFGVGAIYFTIKTELGSDTFLEWVNKNSFDRYILETTDSHIYTNEMIKITTLFKLTDSSVLLREHHYPIEEIQSYLQQWLDDNIN